jgi:hypothetical protein
MSMTVIMKIIELTLHWLITRPNAIPAAGACSVLVMVIMKIESPTDNAAKKIGES